MDVHALFVDVEADEDAQAAIEQELTAAGYLSQAVSHAKIVLAEFELIDRPGAVLPILEVLSRYRINISYMSSQENATGKQFFKMGLYIEEPGVIQTLLKELSTLCPVRILQYDAGEKALDNTVFYITFAGEMRRLLRLTQEETNDFIFNANLVMQQLDERNEPPSKTFEYISRFARFVAEHGGAAYDCRVTRREVTGRVAALVLEPPCGSNITVLEDRFDGSLMMIDSGFACYQRLTMRKLRELIPGFDDRPKELLLTHADCDHCGLVSQFGVIHLSQRSADCFAAERAGQPNVREMNRNTLPYSRLSKIITEYRPPMLSQLHVLNTLPGDDEQPLSLIGRFTFADMNFDVFQGNGGHLPGEIVLFDEEHRVALTGDDYVNIHGYTTAQREFNRLAPYLMTSVNEDSVKAKAILSLIKDKLDGKGWLIFPGHGAVLDRDQSL